MVEAEVQEYGKFEKVSDKKPTLIEGKTFIKHFCNYFSLGVDGKVGFSFDLHRTSSRMGNLAVYGAMGLVKSFTTTKTIKDLTRSLRENHLSIEINGNTQNNVQGNGNIESARQLMADQGVIL